MTYDCSEYVSTIAKQCFLVNNSYKLRSSLQLNFHNYYRNVMKVMPFHRFELLSRDTFGVGSRTFLFERYYNI